MGLSNSKNSAVLVTGGAGFIGSVTALELSRRGFKPVILDDLSTSPGFPVGIEDVHFGEVSDRHLLGKLHRDFGFESIIHFAAKAYVDESMSKPHLYYDINVGGSAALIRFAQEEGITKFIFSSSCATYGVPLFTPISELNEQTPINPYGRSKLMVEQILKDVSFADENFEYISLRYFNAAGAAVRDGIFENHDPETHVIPRLLKAIKNQTPFSIFGTNLSTHDGSPVRDFVHVSDLAEAHILALEALMNGGRSASYNLGTENGISVLELVKEARRLFGSPSEILELPHRDGDPDVLVSDSSLAASALGWSARLSDVRTILLDAAVGIDLRPSVPNSDVPRF